MATRTELKQQGQSVAARRSQPSEDLSKRLGGLVVVEYLMDLFGESPKELFSRIDVLTVLDRVRNDRSFFPESVVATSDRIEAEGRTRRWTRPKSLDGSALVDQHSTEMHRC